MKYLLILVGIAFALAPLVWIKATPGQERVARLRLAARRAGLAVQLVPAPEAPEGERRVEAVRYFLAYGEAPPSLGEWLLARDWPRGRPAPWPGWRWLRGTATPLARARLEAVLAQLPADVYALAAEPGGVAAYLRERGEEADVARLAAALAQLAAP
ncbi:MAG: hypothetical protein KatS3mg124_0102 [Porticoccaceae bacterium]|nr:MAG: hypothetical protein KatS3mg124_0102 [Porticoccaceae bacterium]